MSSNYLHLDPQNTCSHPSTTKQENYDEEEVEILNSYTNTAELIKKFPVTFPTTVRPGLERNIQNRLLT